MKNNFICAVDFGSSKLSGVVGVFNREGKIIDLIMESVASKGVRAGRLADFSQTSNSLENLLKNLQKSSGLKIKEFYASISGNEVTHRHSRAIMPLAERGNRMITDFDIQRLKDQARLLGTNLQEEIIHEIPFGYIVDADNYCRDPRQLYAHRLEIDLLLIYAKLSYIQSIARMAHQIGYYLKKVFYPGFINAQFSTGDGQRTGIDIFCDIGADITDLVMFKDGILQDIVVIAQGADNITRGIAQELNISFELADEIKRSFSIVGDFQDLAEDKEIMVKNANIYTPIKQREVCRIATAEVTTLSSAVKQAIDKMSRLEPINCLYIAGRCVIQEGFLEKFEEIIGVTSRIIRIPSRYFLNNQIYNKLISVPTKMLTYLNAFSMSIYAWEAAQAG
ncbi:MAG: hypothetical protein NC914_00490, partial [Candidatus Omnitrophica bacterium]|nr:hypothetical protein [Candidatus Omnitrophota bacterium]